MTVTNLLSWESDDGSDRCLLIVEDDDKHGNEVGSKRIELCKLDKEKEQWETVDIIDSVNVIQSFGIPKEAID